jgi:hypothetical protein
MRPLHTILVTLTLAPGTAAHKPKFLTPDEREYDARDVDTSISNAFYQSPLRYASETETNFNYYTPDTPTTFTFTPNKNYPLFLILLVPAHSKFSCAAVTLQVTTTNGTTLDNHLTARNFIKENQNKVDWSYFKHSSQGLGPWQEDYTHVLMMPNNSFFFEPFTATSYYTCSVGGYKSNEDTVDVTVAHSGSPFSLTVGHIEQTYFSREQLVQGGTVVYSAQLWNRNLHSRWVLFPLLFPCFATLAFTLLVSCYKPNYGKQERRNVAALNLTLVGSWQTLLAIANFGSLRDAFRAVPPISTNTLNNVMECGSENLNLNLNATKTEPSSALECSRDNSDAWFLSWWLLVGIPLIVAVLVSVYGLYIARRQPQETSLWRVLAYVALSIVFYGASAFTLHVPAFLFTGLWMMEVSLWYWVCIWPLQKCGLDVNILPTRPAKRTAQPVAARPHVMALNRPSARHRYRHPTQSQPHFHH